MLGQCGKLMDVDAKLINISINEKNHHKFVKPVCDSFDISLTLVVLNDKIDKKVPGLYYPKSEAIMLYGDSQNLHTLVHELCHHIMHKKSGRLTHKRQYHGKTFNLLFLFVALVLEDKKLVKKG